MAHVATLQEKGCSSGMASVVAPVCHNMRKGASLAHLPEGTNLFVEGVCIPLQAPP